MSRLLESQRTEIAPAILDNSAGYILASPQGRFSICFSDRALNCCAFDCIEDANPIFAAFEELNSLSPRPMVPSLTIFSCFDAIRPGGSLSEYFNLPSAETFVDTEIALLRIVQKLSNEELQLRITTIWAQAFVSSTEFHHHLLQLCATFLSSTLKAPISSVALELSVVDSIANILSFAPFITANGNDKTNSLVAMVAVCILKLASMRGELGQQKIDPYLKPAERELGRLAADNGLKERAYDGDEIALRLLAYLGTPTDWIDIGLDLQTLNLSSEYLDWQQLEFLEHLKQLRSLNLHGTAIGVSDRIPISNLKKLAVLDLSGTHSTNNTVLQLTDVRTLEELNLSETYVNDASLESLKTMPLLRKVNLRGCRMRTSHELMQVQLPNCEIVV